MRQAGCLTIMSNIALGVVMCVPSPRSGGLKTRQIGRLRVCVMQDLGFNASNMEGTLGLVNSRLLVT
jgi:hypothetical protein